MTPSALTPAARRSAPKRVDAAPPDGSHPRRVRRSAAPASPRRVSGPAQGRAASPRATPRPSRPPRPPRRQQRAALAPKLTLTLPRLHLPRRASAGPLHTRALAFVRSLPDHIVIDRLVRGRAWIPVLGLMLAGIVAMQVEVLKLGAGIGRAVQQTTALSSVNQQLRATVANLSDDQRIESMAQQLGMIMPGPTDVGFVSTGASVQQALGAVHAPSLNDFLNASSHGNGDVAGIGTGGGASGAGAATSSGGATTGAATTTATGVSGATAGLATTTGAATTTGG